MAGKFLSLEEAARRLGVSIDEVNRLVDRKELFPMRSGGTIKFKAEEIERLANERGSGSSPAGDELSLDLELSAPGLASGISGGGELLLADESDDSDSIFAADDEAAAPTGSHTVVRGGDGNPPPSGTFDAEDLVLDSILGAPAPSLTKAVDVGPPAAGGDSGTRGVDLSAVGGSLVDGSLLEGSGPSMAGGSFAIDSGLSLEGPELVTSGIDLDRSLAGGEPDMTGGDLLSESPGEEIFELGADIVDDESASQVIMTDESGDTSQFGSVIMDDASLTDASSGSVEMAEAFGESSSEFVELGPRSDPLSVWQVVGLVCCTLLLCLIGLVVFDVFQTVRAPQGSPVSAPVLNALARTFGW